MIVPSILNPFFSALVDSMEAVLQTKGKQLLLCDSRQDPALEAGHFRSLLDHHVDGIVVSPCHVTDSREAVLSASLATPLVQLDRRIDSSSLDWVGINDDEAMRQIVDHLKERGVRSVAFVASAPTNSSTRDRLQGFRRHTAEAGLHTRDEWIVLEDYSVDSGERAAHGLLAHREQRPDAIVCADDLIAYGVLHACRTKGLAVPEDIQITGFDDLIFSEHVSPPLTSVSQPTTEIAEETFRLLTRRTTDPNHAGSSIALQPRMIVRGSTRAI
jgi:LacI family transcriptional regulator